MNGQRRSADAGGAGIDTINGGRGSTGSCIIEVLNGIVVDRDIGSRGIPGINVIQRGNGRRGRKRPDVQQVVGNADGAGGAARIVNVVPDAGSCGRRIVDELVVVDDQVRRARKVIPDSIPGT